MSVPLRRLLTPAALLALLAAFLLYADRSPSGANPAAAAVPSAQAVGTVTFQHSTLQAAVTMTIRSFSWSGSNTGSSGSGGGGGSGAFTASNPSLGLDVSSFSPTLYKAVATGQHWPMVTVVLYRAGTTTRQEQWTFSETTIKEVRTTQPGPPSRSPREDVVITFRQLRRQTFAANGTTKTGDYCFNVVTVSAC